MNILIQIDTEGYGKINGESVFCKEFSIREKYAEQDIMKVLENIEYDTYSSTLLEWAKSVDPSGRQLHKKINEVITNKKNIIYFGTLYLCLEIKKKNRVFKDPI